MGNETGKCNRPQARKFEICENVLSIFRDNTENQAKKNSVIAKCETFL